MTTWHSTTVHLWSFAPGLEGVDAGDNRRWAMFIDKTPSQVLRATLSKLQRLPQLVVLQAEAFGINLMGDHELREREGEFAREYVPLACFVRGVDLEALTEALQELVELQWRPKSPKPSDNAEAA